MNSEGLKVVDTNIVARLLVRDDPAQVAAAEGLLKERLFIPWTVLLETVWVLSSRYRMARAEIADALERLLDVPSIHVEDLELASWAVERFRAGADFGDLLHMISGRGGAAFLTFDRSVAKAVQPGAPIPVETLRA